MARAGPAGRPAGDSLGVQVWEASIHSQPEVARFGQPFDLHIHLVWGSPGGLESLVPLWKPVKDLDLVGTGYECRSTPDPAVGGYSMHAKLIYRFVARRQGIVPIDTLRVALVRGTAHRTIVFAPTAIRVLPPVSPWPKAWSWITFGIGLVLLLVGLRVARRSRPQRTAGPAPLTPEREEQLRLRRLEETPPSKQSLDALILHIRAAAVRRYGASWATSGEAAFQAWAQASSAPEAVREKVGALVSHLESRRYLPEDPGLSVWRHWIAETGQLWDVTAEKDPSVQTDA